MTSTQLAMILLLSMAPVMTGIVMGLNAKSINAKWRAKREARLYR